MTYVRTLSLSLVFVFGILAGIALVTPHDTSAQTASSGSIPSEISDLQEQISVDITPEAPKPGDTVTLTASGYGTDLNQAKFTWKLDGVTSLTGTGETVFTFVAGKVGNVDTVSLTILPIGGGPAINKTYTFTPGSVDLLWQAHTYTPPFYKGKALVTPQSQITFVAIPDITNSNGTRVSPKNAIYKWSVDYSVQGSKSGYGKDTFTYDTDILLQSHDFSVESYADGQDSTKSGEGDLTITPVTSGALVYINNPLYGTLFNKATFSTNMTIPELTFTAVPYYFSPETAGKSLAYQWNLNGVDLPTPSSQNSLTFTKTSYLGSSDITVNISSPDHILQNATAGFSVTTSNGQSLDE